MDTLPVTVLQFGAGRFLRGFVDRFVQHANDAGQNVGHIVVVQSTPGARAERINAQPDGYHVLVRGYEEGEIVERVETVRSIRRAILAAEGWPEVLRLAVAPELRYLVSNSTEAGYVLDESDRAGDAPPRTMPAKLTQILWQRFQAGSEAPVILPCELFERNADKMRELVLTQSRRWQLPAAFESWLNGGCVWLNNLVDCIITDPTPDLALAKEDPLLVCAEPYALLAIERPKTGTVPFFTDPAIQVVADVTEYYLRKVRMLNGVHTAMVGKFRTAGFATVQQLLADRAAARWIRDLLFEEIVPTLAYRVDGVACFADQVWDRLRNPFTAHKLSDIALHHADKVRIRLQPTCEEYTRLFGKPPRRLVEAMTGTV
jgi:tagaturonate reductase